MIKKKLKLKLTNRWLKAEIVRYDARSERLYRERDEALSEIKTLKAQLDSLQKAAAENTAALLQGETTERLKGHDE